MARIFLLKTLVTFVTRQLMPATQGGNIVDLLDSNTLSSGIVGGSANDTVSTLSQLFGHIVPFIDNEFLVEDLEHFAALKIRHSGGIA